MKKETTQPKTQGNDNLTHRGFQAKTALASASLTVGQVAWAASGKRSGHYPANYVASNSTKRKLGSNIERARAALSFCLLGCQTLQKGGL